MNEDDHKSTGKARVYIAGPMRGYPRFNFPLFDAAAERWRRLGWDVVNPAAIDRESGEDPNATGVELPFSHYMRRDIHLLLTVDAVAFLPGWQESEGARIEHTVARALGLPCFDAILQDPIYPPVSCD